MLRERRPERGEFLTKRTKRLIHDLTESCFSLHTCSRTPPPPQKKKDETEETGRLRKPDTNRVPWRHSNLCKTMSLDSIF